MTDISNFHNHFSIVGSELHGKAVIGKCV